MLKILLALAILSTISFSEYVYICEDGGECRWIFIDRDTEE